MQITVDQHTIDLVWAETKALTSRLKVLALCTGQLCANMREKPQEGEPGAVTNFHSLGHLLLDAATIMDRTRQYMHLCKFDKERTESILGEMFKTAKNFQEGNEECKTSTPTQ